LTIEHSPSLSYRYETGSVSLIESVASRKVLQQPARITPVPGTGMSLATASSLRLPPMTARDRLTDKKHKAGHKFKSFKIIKLTIDETPLAPTWRADCANPPRAALSQGRR